ncbi:fimbrial protein [Pantoea graminicola]|uniref:fimbrial protein n=1 Tax=Pantoea sp. ARC607 TaxID=2027922 RepID=UPI001F38A34F|nr:fimbrial protein [Pantoea sp. ARC607]
MDIRTSYSRRGHAVPKMQKGTGFKTALIIFISLLLSPLSRANDFSQVEGESGTLYVTGALTQGACRLEMQSAWQQINLGTLVTGDFTSLGQRGEAIPFQLILRDCLSAGGHLQDAITGGTTWDSKQPVVSVSFIAPADSDTPELVRVEGAQGLGLRLLDNQQRNVRLGYRSEPLFVAPYHDALTWYVVPERTSAPLVVGPFTATVNFRLNYD